MFSRAAIRVPSGVQQRGFATVRKRGRVGKKASPFNKHIHMRRRKLFFRPIRKWKKTTSGIFDNGNSSFAFRYVGRHALVDKSRLEYMRVAVRHMVTDRRNKLNVRSPPVQPRYQKALNSRMGKGRGKVKTHHYRIPSGTQLWYIKTPTPVFKKKRTLWPIMRALSQATEKVFRLDLQNVKHFDSLAHFYREKRSYAGGNHR
ncbi:MAG: hypothetical protein MHM6MM_000703 [Cercozoa sp. M6MM]